MKRSENCITKSVKKFGVGTRHKLLQTFELGGTGMRFKIPLQNDISVKRFDGPVLLNILNYQWNCQLLHNRCSKEIEE